MKKAVAVLSLAVLAACSAKISTSSQDPGSIPGLDPNPVVEAANNSVVQGTWSTGCVYLGAAGYEITQYKFDGNSLTTYSGLFNTSDCSGDSSMATTHVGTYVLRVDTKSRSGYYGLEFTYDSTLNYNLIEIQGSTLYSGIESNVFTPDDVDSTIPFKLVQNTGTNSGNPSPSPSSSPAPEQPEPAPSATPAPAPTAAPAPAQPTADQIAYCKGQGGYVAADGKCYVGTPDTCGPDSDSVMCMDPSPDLGVLIAMCGCSS